MKLMVDSCRRISGLNIEKKWKKRRPKVKGLLVGPHTCILVDYVTNVGSITLKKDRARVAFPQKNASQAYFCISKVVLEPQKLLLFKAGEPGLSIDVDAM